MKKFLIAGLIAVGLSFSVSAFADGIGVVNMKTLFESANQVKKINDQMKSQFGPRQQKLEDMGKTLQADIDKLQKNKAVMSQKQLSDLNDKIAQEGDGLHQAQASYQQDLFQAKQQAFMQFLNQIRAASQNVAQQQKLEIIIPADSVVYAADSLDVTKQVLAALNK